MKKKLKAVGLAAVSLLVLCIPLFAHHGNASYDTTKKVTVKGTVTQYIWANPHVLLLVDAKDGSGNAVHWIVENQAPSNVTNYGWSKTTFKPGDEVDLEVTPSKNLAANGSAVGRFEGRIVINGRVFKNAGEH